MQLEFMRVRDVVLSLGFGDDSSAFTDMTLDTNVCMRT